jgi:hypothetical protein
MAEYTDDELRAAVVLRAQGSPDPRLRDRISIATRKATRRVVSDTDERQRRGILVRLSAIGVAAVALVIAPLIGAAITGADLDTARSGGQIPMFRAPAFALEAEDGDDEGADEDDDDPAEEAREEMI